MEKILAALKDLLGPDKALADVTQLGRSVPAEVPIYGDSLSLVGNCVLLMARDDSSKFLVEVAESADELSDKFQGEVVEKDGLAGKRCPLSHQNAEALRESVSWTAPVSLRERRTTIGMGDRLGLATPGHLRAARRFKVAPVFAQQSTRELSLTRRTFENVVDDATFLVFQEGYSQGFGADGDHLKSIAEIDQALDAGMPMITLDQTEVMDAAVADWSDEQVDEAFAALPEEDQHRILSRFGDRGYCFEGDRLEFPAAEAKRCAVMYGKALDFTAEAYAHVQARRDNKFDLELSIDETSTPTLPTHHLFIITELRHRNVEVTSLAPRFVGDFQKGVDYIGDTDEFTAQFKIHCAIARAYGNYKISVHSGSDKFSVFPAVGRHSRSRFHLKTAGTSWLEAIRVLAVEEPTLYRDMHKASFDGLEEALKLYKIGADFDKVPDIDSLSDDDLPGLLDMLEARQLLHISYGTLLRHPELGPRIFAALHQHEEAYYEAVKGHFANHLKTLGVDSR